MPTLPPVVATITPPSSQALRTWGILHTSDFAPTSEAQTKDSWNHVPHGFIEAQS